MPGRDGTGPIGTRSKTGRGLGICAGASAVRHGAGHGMGLGLVCRRSFGCGFGRGFAIDTQKKMLQEQKAILQSRLDVVDKQLENL